MNLPPAQPVSDHGDGRGFRNPGHHVDRTWRHLLRWKLARHGQPWPRWVEITPVAPPPPPRDGTLTATWINHATCLLQTRFGNLLTDPIYGERASPLAWIGPRRVHAPGVPWAQLPRIDAVLLSHNHYDHCHLPTLRRLARQEPSPPLALTPLGNGRLLRRAGFAAERIIELDWGEAHELRPGCHVRVTPARHWSKRLTMPRNRALWGGFFIQAGGRTAWFAGDTAYDEHLFAQIQKDCGQPDLALIPVGAYEPRWFMAPQHCNPAEAVRIHLEVGARRSVGVHWGTFQLTDERRDAPPRELARARTVAGVAEADFLCLQPGESVTV
jgi:L-ascorbate metabolism protein UlaG (beta-lactamase superfamily)